jgi:Tol biopolymer transport system component
VTRVPVAAALTLLLAACSGSDEVRVERPSEREPSVVLYTVGASSDPYGHNAPQGVGVAAIEGEEVAKIEVRDPALGGHGGARWIADDLVLVESTRALRRPTVFRYPGGRLEREGPVPFSRLDALLAWSPDGRIVAARPIVRCEAGTSLMRCYRLGASIFVTQADGSGRRRVAREAPQIGGAPGWTPDGRLTFHEPGTGDLVALDLESRERETILAPERIERFVGARSVTLGPHAFSPDGRHLAAFFAARWPRGSSTVGAFVVARADGSPVRVYRSRFTISMLAWSPVDDRLAYTTSGFPDPHELIVVDRPGGEGRRLFVTARHFDWVTWSPDGRRLLLDDEHAARWRLVDTEGQEPAGAIPRLGGRPLWCCPRGPYATIH